MWTEPSWFMTSGEAAELCWLCSRLTKKVHLILNIWLKPGIHAWQHAECGKILLLSFFFSSPQTLRLLLLRPGCFLLVSVDVWTRRSENCTLHVVNEWRNWTKMGRLLKKAIQCRLFDSLKELARPDKGKRWCAQGRRKAVWVYTVSS